MAAHVLNAGGEVFSILVTIETTDEDLATVIEAAKVWRGAHREIEARRVEAQAAFDSIMNPTVEDEPEDGEGE